MKKVNLFASIFVITVLLGCSKNDGAKTVKDSATTTQASTPQFPARQILEQIGAQNAVKCLFVNSKLALTNEPTISKVSTVASRAFNEVVKLIPEAAQGALAQAANVELSAMNVDGQMNLALQCNDVVKPYWQPFNY